MNRRNVIAAVGLTAMGAIAPSAVEAVGRHPNKASRAGVFSNQSLASAEVLAMEGPYATCVSAAGDLIAAGEICVTKMIGLLANGNQEMETCAELTQQVIPVGVALRSLAAQQAPLTPGIAKLAIKACAACAEACKPHMQMHQECASCYDSCIACIEACKAVI